MAFWGVEVKTGRPFTHISHNVKGRLRISQATLGTGSAAQKSLVQCNVGKKSPVLLCVLVPEKAESCHLDLEFEESDDVVFSVVGPRSVFLTGYYLRSSHHHNMPSDSESFGEDIGDSDGMDQCSDEDEYEDSFIDDDDDPKADGPSLDSSSNTEIETSMEDIPKGGKSKLTRLKKRCQVIESDDDVIGEASEDEDNFILSGFKSMNSDKNIAGGECDKPKVNFGDENKNANANIIDGSDDEIILSFDAFKGKGKGAKASKQSNKPTVDVGSEVKNAYNRSCENQPDTVNASNDQISEFDAVTCEKPTKKRKERSEDVKNIATSVTMTKEVKEEHPKDMYDNVNQDPHKNVKEESQINEMKNDADLDDMGSAKLKKRRKKSGKISVVGTNSECEADKREGEGCPGHTEFPAKIEEIQPPYSNNVSDEKPDQPAMASASEIKSKKKKNKKSTTEDNGKNVTEKPDNDVELVSDLENKKADLKPESTLSNGMVIIELSKSKLDGKVATTGKKVKIQYTAMLKENAHVIDSNFAKSPYKFRLGKKGAIEGLHLGVNGMCVGDKRKLIIPPSMGYGNEGAGENVPPNSWLVYEVELLGVSR